MEKYAIEKTMALLKLKFNPYTYTRVQVMRTLLLKTDDYDRLLKLSFSEIAQYLSKTSYRKQIEELGLKYSGADLLERALNKNLVMTFNKIRMISDINLRLTLDTYLLREDFHNLKIIIRGLVSQSTPDEIREIILPFGFLKDAHIEALLQKKTPKEVLSSSGIVLSSVVKSLFERGEPAQLEIENALDNEYFRHVMEFAGLIKGEGKHFSSFLQTEIDIYNLISVIRFVRLGMSPQEIKRFLQFGGRYITKKRLARLAECQNVEAMVNILWRTPFQNILADFIKNNRSFMYLKAAFHRALLKKSMNLMHQNMLSVDVILAFALAKETEVKNLKNIVKGKQLDIDSDIIEQELVY